MKNQISTILFLSVALAGCVAKMNNPDFISKGGVILSEVGHDLLGYQIVFASAGLAESDQDIWIINSGGTGDRNLTGSLKGGFDIYPEWSPDAKYVYYTSDKHTGETLELYRVNTIGEPKPKQITALGKEVRSLSVSPENKHIALGVMSASVPLGADLKPYSSDLYILAIDKVEKSLARQELIKMDDMELILSEPVEDHIWHEQPHWEPGKPDSELRIAYVRTQNYDNDPIMVDEIWSVSIDGSNNRILSTEGSMPRWTRDGKKMATHEFFVIDMETNEVQELEIADLKSDAGSASLSPDQKYVLFETTDRKRLGGIALAKYKNESAKFINPYKVLSKRPMYEPRWSPIAIASEL